MSFLKASNLALYTAQGLTQIVVSCDRIWNETSGHFNISVTWGLEPISVPTTHITQFTVSPMLLHNGLTTTAYTPLTQTPRVGVFVFL